MTNSAIKKVGQKNNMNNKTKKYYKTVLLPIEVTYGNFCWGDGRICEHFDSEGGHPTCDLGFGPLKSNIVGWIPKPVKCLTLKETK